MRNHRKAVLFISNVIDSPIYRQIIQTLLQNNWDVTYIFFGKETESLMKYAESLGLKVSFYQNLSRKKAFSHIFKIGILILRIKPIITMTFGQTATLIGFTASTFSSKSTRIYLRMHTSMNKVEKYRFGSFYDRFSNFLAHKIIVPNDNTKEYLIGRESVNSDSIEVISFGFELDDFKHLDEDRKQRFQEKYKFYPEFFYIGIASRFAPAKGLEYSIPAIAKLMDEYPNIRLVLTGVGERITNEFQSLLTQLDTDRYMLIDRVVDMSAFYNCIDLFVHTPIDSTVESFGLVYVEAMATGLPCVFTLSGIAKEIAVNDVNCLVVDYRNESSIHNAIKRIYNDADLTFKISSQSSIAVIEFDMKKMCDRYLQIFESELNSLKNSKT